MNAIYAAACALTLRREALVEALAGQLGKLDEADIGSIESEYCALTREINDLGNWKESTADKENTQ